MVSQGHLEMIRYWVLGLFSAALLLASPAMAAQDKIALSAYAKSPVGSILFLRHALAPGNGDPADFTLADCASQRNLDAVGRRQAATLGELYRQHAIAFPRIYSSQWCRCRETARLLEMGPVVDLPGLNSFYQGIVPREATLEALRAAMSELPDDGGLTLMVTHYVTISAITGIGVASGEAVAFDPATGRAVKLDLAQ